MARKISGSVWQALIGGTVFGILVALVAGFGGGLVVTEAKLALEKQDARIAALAEACEGQAVNHWREQGNELAALEGFTNEQRTELAERFAINNSGEERIGRQIVDACDDALRERVQAAA